MILINIIYVKRYVRVDDGNAISEDNDTRIKRIESPNVGKVQDQVTMILKNAIRYFLCQHPAYEKKDLW